MAAVQTTYPLEFNSLCEKFFSDEKIVLDENENDGSLPDLTFAEKFFLLEKKLNTESNNIIKKFLSRPDVKEYFLTKKLNKNKIDVIFYHGGCFDGFGSAYIIWSYFKKNMSKEFADNLKYIGCKFLNPIDTLNETILSTASNNNIIMCDFSYRLSELLKIIVLSKTFLIIDHHKTAQTDLSYIYPELKIFDMKKSGVGITWEYFYDNSQSIPKFLDHIQDRDIWANQLANTNEFVTYFYQQEMNFDLWDTYLQPENVDSAIAKGSAWIEYQNIMIDRIMRKASYIIQEIDGEPRIVVYSNSTDLKSDIGNKLFNKIPIADFSVVWDYDIWKNQTVISLRSTNDRLDVSVIAKKFGGGGHRNASGLAYEGCQPILKFDRIEDPGILELMLNGKNNTLMIGSNLISYVMFDVKEVRPIWLENKYLTLLKKKMNVHSFIVFRSVSENVKFNDETQSIIKLFDYTIVFNEHSNSHGLSKLEYFAGLSQDNHLVFTSEKDFSEIFTRPIGDSVIETESDSESDADI